MAAIRNKVSARKNIDSKTLETEAVNCRNSTFPRTELVV